MNLDDFKQNCNNIEVTRYEQVCISLDQPQLVRVYEDVELTVNMENPNLFYIEITSKLANQNFSTICCIDLESGQLDLLLTDYQNFDKNDHDQQVASMLDQYFLLNSLITKFDLIYDTEFFLATAEADADQLDYSLKEAYEIPAIFTEFEVNNVGSYNIKSESERKNNTEMIKTNVALIDSEFYHQPIDLVGLLLAPILHRRNRIQYYLHSILPTI